MTRSVKPTRLWYPVILIDENLPTGLHSAQAWFFINRRREPCGSTRRWRPCREPGRTDAHARLRSCS